MDGEGKRKEMISENVNLKIQDSHTMEWRTSSFVDDIWVKDLGASDGYVMQLVKFAPGASFPKHQHRRAEFMYILEGELLQNDHKLSKGFVSISDPLSFDESVLSPNGCLFLLLSAE